MFGQFLVAVHGGAGFHDEDSDVAMRKALRIACKKTSDSLLGGDSALSAVAQAVSSLEDDPCLNAGYGSNLTLDGTAECDASIMDGRSQDYGSVGAVSGVKNPIEVARAVLQHSRIVDPLGRIPPLLLTGGGATAFALKAGVECVPPEDLICPRSKREWEHWKSRLELNQTPDLAYSTVKDLHKLQDTVGAVAWNASGDLAAGASSGGLLLKHPGRVGEAAVYGAGCWASQSPQTAPKRGVACSISGSGEYIIRMSMAKTIGEAVASSEDADVHDILHRVLSEFYDTCYARGETEPSAGVLLLNTEVDEDNTVTPRLWCAFTTHSMAISYASSLDPKPKAVILRRPPARDGSTGRSIYITTLSLTR